MYNAEKLQRRGIDYRLLSYPDIRKAAGNDIFFLKVPVNDVNLQDVIDLDFAAYKDSHLKKEWYKERYNKTKSDLIICYNSELDDVIGYIMVSPIKEDLYKAIINGVLGGDIDINPEMFVDKSDYYYISSCVIRDEYQKQGLGSFLMRTVTRKYQNKYLCAISISEGGYKILSKYLKIQWTIPNNKYVFINKKKL